MTDVDRYLEANRRHWDELVGVHMTSKLYDLEGFKRGTRGLHAIERAELGDVEGKTLLHLQCHFGLDTLSWARLGARATGVDFSAEAIRAARALGEEIGVDARFVEADIYELPDVLDEEFDVVFTSYGALVWLYDHAAWGELVARYVRPGGTFYVAEFHPTGFMFDETDEAAFTIKYPYFFSPEPLVEDGSDYADPDAVLEHATRFSWIYSISDVVNALVTNGLRIEFLHEFPYSPFQQFAFLERRDDAFWHIPDHLPQLPLLFSIKATKP